MFNFDTADPRVRMRKHLIKELSQLTAAGIISEETSERITTYYHDRTGRSPSRLMLAFAILGALRMGLGIILIIAHNWDEFSKSLKIFRALLPLVAGQSLYGYTLTRYILLLNYGLITAALIICRFFDTDMSFVFRSYPLGEGVRSLRFTSVASDSGRQEKLAC